MRGGRGVEEAARKEGRGVKEVVEEGQSEAGRQVSYIRISNQNESESESNKARGPKSACKE